MSKNKTFFQKLSDSLVSLFPFSSTKDQSATQSSSTRRLASEAFGQDANEDVSKTKRAKLHHDPMLLPSSRIIKQPLNQPDKISIFNNFNDAASEISECSNISVSTSGVSSLHPRSTKRTTINLNIDENYESKLQSDLIYPRNLNLSHRSNSPLVSNRNRATKRTEDFISSPARKILEKLDKLTTPITSADKVTTVMRPLQRPALRADQFNPYKRPNPPIYGKKPPPIKAVSVSVISTDNQSKFNNGNQSSINNNGTPGGPIRRKQRNNQPMKRLGFYDDIDLDNDSVDIDDVSYRVPQSLTKIREGQSITSIRLPAPKKSRSTSTDLDIDYDDKRTIDRSTSTEVDKERERSPMIEFSFRPPASIHDADYQQNIDLTSSSTKPIGNIKKKLWRCNTCFSENQSSAADCGNCGNLPKTDGKPIVILSQTEPVSSIDKTSVVKKALEKTPKENPVEEKSQEKPTESQSIFQFSNATSSAPSFGFLSSTSAVTTSSPAISDPVEKSSTVFSSAPVTVPSEATLSTSTTSVSNDNKSLFSFPQAAKPVGESQSSISSGFSFLSSSIASSTPSAVANSDRIEFKPFQFGAVVSSAPASTSSTPISINSMSSLSSSVSFSPFTFGQSSSCTLSTQSATVPSTSIFSLSQASTTIVPASITMVTSTPFAAPVSNINSVANGNNLQTPAFVFGGANQFSTSVTKQPFVFGSNSVAAASSPFGNPFQPQQSILPSTMSGFKFNLPPADPTTNQFSLGGSNSTATEFNFSQTAANGASLQFSASNGLPSSSAGVTSSRRMLKVRRTKR